MIELIVVLIFVGFALWLLPQLPLDAGVARIIRGIVLFILILYVLDFALHMVGVKGIPAHRHW